MMLKVKGEDQRKVIRKIIYRLQGRYPCDGLSMMSKSENMIRPGENRTVITPVCVLDTRV